MSKMSKNCMRALGICSLFVLFILSLKGGLVRNITFLKSSITSPQEPISPPISITEIPSIPITEVEADDQKDISKEEFFMKTLRQNDRSLVAKVLNLNLDLLSENESRETLYSVLSTPVQGVCRVMKRFGGVWIKHKHVIDGDKFICMDKLRLNPSECIIYSFGINNEWSFEDLADKMGCSIYAYDHTTNSKSRRGRNIHFMKKGVYTEKTADKETLDWFMEKNGHQNKTINYLKVDIEGAELRTLPQWIETGSLAKVEQIAMELHLKNLHKENRFKRLLKAVKDLYQIGFRVISYEPNNFVGPQPLNGAYYTPFFEVVLMKDTVWKHLDQIRLPP